MMYKTVVARIEMTPIIIVVKLAKRMTISVAQIGGIRKIMHPTVPRGTRYGL